jgi:pimeloyl-ACP methyl ester carboxylesterase
MLKCWWLRVRSPAFHLRLKQRTYVQTFMGFINIGTEKLHYLQMGNGPKILLAFHGYGNEAALFAPFEKYLEHEYTILSFDLPHHGSSKWTEDLPLTQKDLVHLFREVLAIFKVDKVSLMGYSIGGRICLNAIALVPELVDRTLLMAADGLATHRFYYIMTRTAIGRRIFRYTLQNPHLSLPAINWLRKMKLVAAARHQYTMHYIGSDQNRSLLLQVWPGLSDLMISPAKIKETIRKHQMPVTLIMGAHDFVIRPALGTKFSKGLNSVNVVIIQKGHRVFDVTNAGEIAQHLL